VPCLCVERCNVNLTLKNTVLVLAAVGFASMASGLTLHLHLACAEDADHHHSADCSLCHAMLLGAAKFQPEAQSAIVRNDDFAEAIPQTGELLRHPSTLAILGPRPPPIDTP